MVKLLVGVRVEQFAGVPEDLAEQSGSVLLAEDAVDAAQKAGTAKVVGWDPGAAQEHEHGRREVDRER